MADRRTIREAPAGWTREQIEKWVGEAEVANDRCALVTRRALVRLCPEAPDYEELVERLREIPGYVVSSEWRRAVSDEEIAAHAARAVAALWAQSLSEPVEGDAPCATPGSREP